MSDLWLTALPVYNEVAHVNAVLDEVRRFSSSVLVVDDGSSDGTAELLGRRGDVIVETQVHLSASGALAARRAGCPLVLDDCSPVGEEATWGAGLPALARRLFREQVQRAERAVVSSHALRERLVAEGVPRDKLCVVPNGVERAAFTRAAGVSRRAQLGLQDRLLLGFVGSFQPWHQVDRLVDALARLECPPAHLLLVGDGPCRDAARVAAARLGLDARVTFLGAVPAEQVPAWTAAFDVGVLPGTNDYGQPMKLVEYAAAGVPAVAPDVAPVREVIEHGVTGLLFAPGDVAALAGALACLARDEALRRRLGECARRRLPAEAEWRARARELVAALAPHVTQGAAA